MYAAGVNTFYIFVNLPDKGTTYNNAKSALTDYFKRPVLRRIRQEHEEKMYARLRQAVSSCVFTDLDGESKFHAIQITTES